VLKSIQGLCWASKGDFVVKRAKLQFGNRIFKISNSDIQLAQLNGTLCHSQSEDLTVF